MLRFMGLTVGETQESQHPPSDMQFPRAVAILHGEEYVAALKGGYCEIRELQNGVQIARWGCDEVCEIPKEDNIFHRPGKSPEPRRINVERGQKDGYGRETAILSNDQASILNSIETVDKSLGVAHASVTFIREGAETSSVQKSQPSRVRMHRHCRYFGIERGDTVLASSSRRWILDAPPN